MKRLIAALLLGLIILTGCTTQDDAPVKKESIIPDDAVISPNGKLAVCQYIKEDLKDENGLLYSIYDVQLYDNDKNTMICTFHIVGRDFSFLWSPDSKYVAAVYSGRTWTHFSTLEVQSHSANSFLGISEIIDSFKNSGEKFDYEIDQDRPDPYVSTIEWSPDSTRILVSYQVRDTAYKTQSGVFVYSFANGTFSNLLQNSPSEADHVDIKKPENFIWN